MRRSRRRPAENLRLTVLLGINIFILINLVLASTGFIGRLLIQTGVFKLDDYLHFRAVVMLIFLISIALTLTTTVRIRSLYVKPYRKMIAAMQDLADGHFNTRISLDANTYHPRETLEFVESFNITAEKLGSVEILRNDFINNFSHEFKTPIASIQGFAKLIREENLPADDMKEYLDIIIQETERLTLLSGNVLELSKVESQETLTNSEEFQIGEQIRQCALLLQTKWQTKSIDLQTEIDDAVITGDAMMLKQVWLNLIDNAVKFSPAGGTIEIHGTNAGDSYQVMITDHGAGMNEEVSARIFEKFFQGTPSHTIKGNGLGLTITASIIRLHAGTISVSSSPGKGSTFTVILTK